MPGNNPKPLNESHKYQLNGGGIEPTEPHISVLSEPTQHTPNSDGSLVGEFWVVLIFVWVIGLVLILLRKNIVKKRFSQIKDYLAYAGMEREYSFILYFSMIKLAYKHSEEAKTGWSLFAVFNMITSLHSKPGYTTLLKKHNENAGKAYCHFLDVVKLQKRYWMGEGVIGSDKPLDLSHPGRLAILKAIIGMLNSMPQQMEPAVTNCFIELVIQEKEMLANQNKERQNIS